MEITVIVPGVPDQRANPNASCSERTRKRYRKAWANDAVMPVRAARMAQEASFPIAGAVTVDLLIRWPKGRNTYGDRQNVITMAKELVDVLQHEGMIVNDREVRMGSIEQERASQQPETVLTVREPDGSNEALARADAQAANAADRLLAAIESAGYVVIERSTLLLVYGALMATGKTQTARMLFEAMALPGSDLDPSAEGPTQ